YIEGLTLKNCRLKGTDLSFEYCSDIDAEFDEADSIKNPSSGVIKARRIGEVILDEHQDKTRKTQIEIAEK
ncbi:MAG: DUF3737 family protein, partial [Bacilli bacterium]|nr:DUF3737 family protein [Bacilli bacterium]